MSELEIVAKLDELEMIYLCRKNMLTPKNRKILPFKKITNIYILNYFASLFYISYR